MDTGGEKESCGGRIVDLLVYDLRFPTSLGLDGSDASHPDPDYSAVYVVLKTGKLKFLKCLKPVLDGDFLLKTLYWFR